MMKFVKKQGLIVLTSILLSPVLCIQHIIPCCCLPVIRRLESLRRLVKVVNDLTNEDHLSFIGKLPVCEEDCILSEWAEWGPCSESCGSDGQQVSFLFVYYLVYLPIFIHK